ncbi:Hypothetical_protein [Hexamita inflata]|uniref:Hypothetical_protein n=1 Tax=Hexamita inflata TaxID=28002 RepID=A0AA86UAB9_9EUKA|nr:Hypothetical protein HINF_LOCUS37350 [Hexamita inflata]CAI9949714.1 Hypothetical protein HINF_LOCUS37359 [Hexamita inflata]CAI9949723.1 Hypothetical protein HINF_LOCUS37368 [Hexamita inflata]CAI9954801.1 Hypothetical protein HINF_LOCUS42446 [Hexamita inflata]
MGRPFTINFEAFTNALAQGINLLSNTQHQDDQDLYESFKQYPRAMRAQLWEQMGAALNKTAVQVKNYFFNTWAERVSRREPRTTSQDFEVQEIVFTPFSSLFDESLM